jgi:electron transport complex protein RnfG
VDGNGVISGVRVIEHRETPGLGDYIDAARSPWSQQFIGRRISDGLRWQVKKDGGPFDAMAGATISARAVTAAVGRAANVLARLPAEHSEGKQP